jgi:hypothetical protein
MMTKRRLLPALPLLLVLLAGCTHGPTVARVSGTVKYRGAPVSAGTIAFHPAAGGYYFVSLEPDGTYAVPDVPVGEAAVTIETESANPKTHPAPEQYGANRGHKSPVGPGPGGAAPPTQAPKGAYVKIPAKYAQKETSKLTVTLTGGAQTQNFDLAD